MQNPQANGKKSILFFLFVLEWFALIAQFYLIIVNRVAPIPETIIRYFSFFTILTNLFVAVCFSVLLLKLSSRLGNFFASPKTLTAITVYITVVGIVYNLILRFLWKPKGLQWAVDELLHTIIPLLCIVYWIFYVYKSSLKWRDAFLWLIYPFVYIIFILIRGSWSSYYPYPFINVDQLGLNKVLLNSGFLTLSFLLISFIAIAVGKKLRR
jgi:uncharacterized protein YacL